MTQLDQEDYHLFHYSLVYPKDLHVSSIVYEGIGGVSILFFYEKFLGTQKSVKSKQTTFTQIFYAHKKHKKWLLLTYFKHLKNMKSDFYS